MARLSLVSSMTRHPHSIRAGESLRTAEKMLEKLGCHHLPVRDGGALATVTELPLGDDVGFVGGVSWDALHPTDVAVACDAAIHVWDTRARARTRSIERAVPPGCCVRAVSFNSNKPWHLASGGDDYKVKVWDLRRPATPVNILDGHTHW